MVLKLRPGEGLGCIINSHRHGWRGDICKNPNEWTCGAKADFRERNCAAQRPLCYHLHVFDQHRPRLSADGSGLSWLLRSDPNALDDQILLLWSRAFTEPHGAASTDAPPEWVSGVYRVKSSECREIGYREEWIITPHDDGWARFADLKVRVPEHYPTGGPYLRSVPRWALDNVVRKAQSALEEGATLSDPDDAKRLVHFVKKMPGWLDVAGARIEELQARVAEREPVTVFDSGSRSAGSPFRAMDALVTAEGAQSKSGDQPVRMQNKAPVASPSPAKPVASDSDSVLVEPDRLKWIEKVYGDEVAQSLRIASLTKPLVVLRGDPGVGKSHLALRLLKDDARERTRVVHVSATWRGREDLIGYPNPISNEFEPTPFTAFLIATEKAWREGDKRPRNVVFEEFNLAQPEHWLADVLSITQYEDLIDRKLHLGGASVRGHDQLSSPDVCVSPNIRFVATLNSDHTTRTLSPRVLDRAAVIDITLTADEALERVELQLEDDLRGAVAKLDYVLRPTGASFSIRTAFSLKRSLSQIKEVPAWRVLDFVLAQEVLSKVQLMANDAHDEDVMSKLQDWVEAHGSNLSACSRRVEEWKGLLDRGLDVTRA